MRDTYSRQSLDLEAIAGMGVPKAAEPAVGTSVAVIYALVAHRLTAFYDEGYRFTEAQAAAMCAEWLARSGKTMPLAQRKQLANLSEQVSAHITNALSREAGLFTAHELMESLDPRHVSEVGASIMEECVRVLKESAEA